jgi:hypothetical protein
MDLTAKSLPSGGRKTVDWSAFGAVDAGEVGRRRYSEER